LNHAGVPTGAADTTTDNTAVDYPIGNNTVKLNSISSNTTNAPGKSSNTGGVSGNPCRHTNTATVGNATRKSAAQPDSNSDRRPTHGAAVGNTPANGYIAERSSGKGR
jgi:hypothetical protein